MKKKTPINSFVLLSALVVSGGLADAADCEGEDQSKAPAVGQKVALLERLLTDSEPLRRAEGSGDPATLDKIAGARAVLAEASQALEDGCLATASSLSSEGLQLATAAFKSTPAADPQQRDNYEAAFQRATSFLLSLESQPRESWGISEEDLVGIERQIERAGSLASGGSFAQATRALAPVNDRLQRRLFEILNDKTLYYEKNFSTPADEYEYLKEQYSGYLMLLRSDEKTASYSAQNRISALLEQAAAEYAAAEEQAAEGRWPEAIAGIEAAISSCDRAVRATGYIY